MRVEIEESKLNETMELHRKMYSSEPTHIVEALLRGSKFRLAGLTPFYILDDETDAVWVTSEEFMDNKLH